MPIISDQDFKNAKRDIDDIGISVNEDTVVSPRYGEDYESLPRVSRKGTQLITDLQNAVNTIIIDDGVPAMVVLDPSGKNQKEINSSNKIINNNILDYFTKQELADWINDPISFDASDAIIRAQTMSTGATINLPSGQFKITKPIPSSKHWSGVGGGFDPQGTIIFVDSETAIDGVIDATGNSTDIQLSGLFFKGVQNRIHTLYRSKNGYMVRHKRLRVDSFAYGFVSKGTYDFFDDCYFNDNAVAIKPVEFNPTNQSTMYGYRNCVFTYNAKAFDVSQTSGHGTYEDWVNILFESCGFEANEYGIYAPQRMWYVTLLNCWFEDNSAYGLYSPSSHVLEINTRHNANSPRLVDETNTSQLFSMLAQVVDLEIKGKVNSSLNFNDIYESNGNSEKAGNSISQSFSDDGGRVTARVQMLREAAGIAYGGSAIAFHTALSTASPIMRERWRVTRGGDFRPYADVSYSIGDENHRASAVYTAKVMYTENVGDFYGNGSPEGVISAHPGSTYRRIDGVTPCFFVKQSGLLATGWVAK